MLNSLYDIYIEKLEGLYSKRPANQAATLKLLKNNFIEMNSLKDKSKILNEILVMLRCDVATTSNIKDIGGGSSVGSMKINKNSLLKYKVILKNQSVTGIFENRVEL